MGLSLPKSNLIILKKCLDKWVHFKLLEIIKRNEASRKLLYGEGLEIPGIWIDDTLEAA